MFYKRLVLGILVLFTASFFAVADSEISYDYLMNLGYESAAKGDLDGAIGYFTRAHRVYPPGKEAVNQIAILNERIKKIQDVIEPPPGQFYAPYDKSRHLYEPRIKPKVKTERELDAKYKSAAELMIDIEEDKKETKEMLSQLETDNEMLAKDNASLRQEIERIELQIKEREQLQAKVEDGAEVKVDKELEDIRYVISIAEEENSALKGQNEYLKAALEDKKTHLETLKK